MKTVVFFVLIFALDALPLEETRFPAELFWNHDLVASLKAPFAQQDRDGFATKLQSLRVVALENGCGRLKNRLAILEDGTKICCRYRDSKTDIRSDLYAYYFAALLGIESLPPTLLATVDLSDQLWSSVATEAKTVGWVQGSYVELAMYVDNLSNEYIPDVLKPEKAMVTKELVKNFSASEKLRLVQWTDMIAFDYMTGHTDRLFNTLLNLQWSPNMLQKPVHNLEVTPGGYLVLLDNESAFWLGYAAARMKSSYRDLQAHFLNKICVFKNETIDSVKKLASSDSPWDVLEQYVKRRDPESYLALGPLAPGDQMEMAVRLRDVMARVQWCTNHLS